MELTTIFDSDRAEYEYMQEQNEKQAIEEMAKVIEITEQIARDAHCGLPSPTMYAKDLYWHGYRKQSEGEWIDSLKGYCQCSNCRTSFETLPTTFLFKLNNRFCRHCGAKMKGGE